MFVELWATDPAKVEHFKTIQGLVCLVVIATRMFSSREKVVVRRSTVEKNCGGFRCLPGGQRVPTLRKVVYGPQLEDS